MAYVVISLSFTKASLTAHVLTKTERYSGALQPTTMTKKACGASVDTKHSAFGTG